MAQSHFILPTIPDDASVAVRLGAGNAETDRLSALDTGKIVKLVGESRYNLSAVGDEIEATIYAVELAPQNGFTIGSVLQRGRLLATFDGLQGTPGTGVVAIGDIVVTGTPVPKVCKATTPANVVHKWRVVSLGTVGTGAVGTVGVIERI